MWKRVKDNLDSGVEKVKWFSSLFNERIKVEISLFKLLFQVSEMEKRRTELMRTIGERTFELRQVPEKQLMRDPVIQEAIADIEKLNAALEDVKKKVSEIEKVEA